MDFHNFISKLENLLADDLNFKEHGANVLGLKFLLGLANNELLLDFPLLTDVKKIFDMLRNLVLHWQNDQNPVYHVDEVEK